MKSTISIVRAALLLLAAALPLYAVSGVTVWENTFHRPLPGAGNQSVLAARELADGTTLTVMQDNSGITTLQYDHSGNQSVVFHPVYYPSVVSIDPFAAVFVASVATEGFGSQSDITALFCGARF